MNKTTAQIIVVSVIALVIVNITLLGLMWRDKKNYRPRERRPVKEINAFIIREIGFDRQQAEIFIELSNKHHQVQRQNQDQFRRIKDEINKLMLEGEDAKMDSLIAQFADVCVLKEAELYRFFKEVLVICNDEQKSRLQKVFFEATGPPPYARMPFDNDAKGQRPPR